MTQYSNTSRVCSASFILDKQLLYSKYSGVCYNEHCYNEQCYNEQFLSIKSGCYNEREGIQLAEVARACAGRVGLSRFDQSVSHLFVIICKVQLPVYFSYLLICAFSTEFFKICYIILVMSRQNRVRKLINLDIKKGIISKRESGGSVED